MKFDFIQQWFVVVGICLDDFVDEWMILWIVDGFFLMSGCIFFYFWVRVRVSASRASECGILSYSRYLCSRSFLGADVRDLVSVYHV